MRDHDGDTIAALDGAAMTGQAGPAAGVLAGAAYNRLDAPEAGVEAETTRCG